jgi:hypothetical protein
LIQVKMREEEEMNKRLGIKPGQGPSSSTSMVGDVLLRGSLQNTSASRAGTGSNRAPIDAAKSRWNTGGTNRVEEEGGEEKLSKGDRRAARRLAKIQVKEERRAERSKRREDRSRHHEDYSSDHDGGERRRGNHSTSRGQPSHDRYHDRYDRRGEVGSGRHHDQDNNERRRRDDEYRDRGRHEEDRQMRYESRSDKPSVDRHREEGYRRKERSRSPGRSITPEMQRRKRD